MRHDALVVERSTGEIFTLLDNNTWLKLHTRELVPWSEIKQKKLTNIELSPQELKIVLRILKTGSVTSYEAVTKLNIVALTTRISEMRAKGLPIQSVTVRYENADDEHVHYNVYYFWKDKIENDIRLKGEQ